MEIPRYGFGRTDLMLFQRLAVAGAWARCRRTVGLLDKVAGQNAEMACHAGFSCSDEPDFAVMTHPRSIASRGDNAARPAPMTTTKAPLRALCFPARPYAGGLLGTAWNSTPHGASPMPDPIPIRSARAFRFSSAVLMAANVAASNHAPTSLYRSEPVWP